MVLQEMLPLAPWTDPRVWRLPGTQLADPDAWVQVDDAYAGQMRLRNQLISEQRGDVLALLPEAKAAAAELYDMGLSRLSRMEGFAIGAKTAMCPDCKQIVLKRSDPLGTLGRLIQEDLCILQKLGGSTEHILTGAVLCFPAGWTLAEKIGRPLGRIHAPVARYHQVGPRVQRMLDGLKPGRPVWRANAHFYDDPTLFAPRTETDARNEAVSGRFVRSEYQVLFRLPVTGAIVFSIHTYVVARGALSDVAEAALVANPLSSGQ
ncbi:MAG: DUF3445 domain-containing protein [Pseudomonadota bacterium]